MDSRPPVDEVEWTPQLIIPLTLLIALQNICDLYGCEVTVCLQTGNEPGWEFTENKVLRVPRNVTPDALNEIVTAMQNLDKNNYSQPVGNPSVTSSILNTITIIF
jgi:hypothetical protein